MLSAWHNFFMEVDPDIVIGYNITKFDIPYLLRRASKLGLTLLPFMGRLEGSFPDYHRVSTHAQALQQIPNRSYPTKAMVPAPTISHVQDTRVVYFLICSSIFGSDTQRFKVVTSSIMSPSNSCRRRKRTLISSKFRCCRREIRIRGGALLSTAWRYIPVLFCYPSWTSYWVVFWV